MKQSYNIKHDFLFKSEELNISIPFANSDLNDVAEIKLTDALNATNEIKFMELIDTSKNNVIIKDDIGKCKNPASERYKQFIIKCIARKLIDLNKNVYL